MEEENSHEEIIGVQKPHVKLVMEVKMEEKSPEMTTCQESPQSPESLKSMTPSSPENCESPKMNGHSNRHDTSGESTDDNTAESPKKEDVVRESAGTTEVSDLKSEPVEKESQVEAIPTQPDERSDLKTPEKVQVKIDPEPSLLGTPSTAAAEDSESPVTSDKLLLNIFFFFMICFRFSTSAGSIVILCECPL